MVLLVQHFEGGKQLSQSDSGHFKTNSSGGHSMGTGGVGGKVLMARPKRKEILFPLYRMS